MPSSVLGGILLVAAGSSLAVLNVFNSWTEQQGWPSFGIMAASYAMASLVLGAVAAWEKPTIERSALPWLAQRSIFGALAAIFAWLAIHSGTSPGNVSAIVSTQLAMAAILGRVLLGEQLCRVQVAAIAVAVVAAVVIALTEGHSGSDTMSYRGVVFSLLAAACKASIFVVSRKLTSVPNSCISFGVSVCGFAVCTVLHQMDEPGMFVMDQPLEAFGVVAAGFAMTLLIIILTAAGSKLVIASLGAALFTSAYIIVSYASDIMHSGMLPAWPTVAAVVGLLLAVFVLSWAQSKSRERTAELKVTESKTFTADLEEGSLDAFSTMGEGDEALARHIQSKHPGTGFLQVEGSRWGHLIVPGERHCMSQAGSLRVVLFTSSEPGKVMVEAVLAYARKFPGSLELVGVATDHPVDPNAKISLKKRFWKFASQSLRLLQESTIVDSVISASTEVYTGEIKCDGFRKLLKKWQPDVIISTVFGQLVDAEIINTPPEGIYNFHPSDLLNGIGAGASPWEDMERLGTSRTVWSVHQMTEGIDEGKVVGQSPPIEVGDASGVIPQNRMLYIEYVAKRLSWTASRFLSGLVEHHRAGAKGLMKQIQLDGHLPQQQLESMLEPVTAGDLALSPNRRLQMVSSFDPEVLEAPGWLVTAC